MEEKVKDLIDDFLLFRARNAEDVLKDSKVIYEYFTEFCDEQIVTKVVELCDGKLVVVNSDYYSTNIMPLVIQYTNDGELLDSCYEEFINSYKGDLSPYKIDESGNKMLFPKLAEVLAETIDV